MNKTNLNTVLKELSQHNISLVLVDLGASGDNWEPFELLKDISDLLRFDPDIRDVRDLKGEKGHRIITFNRAVVESEVDNITFYLTKSPYCSSTLKPDFERLSSYPYSDLFEVVGTASVPAITLNQAVVSTGFKQINWIKLDTQGTEFRILKSIPENLFDTILVCDIEASLYPHYIGADTLPAMHELMLENDFWVVEMRPHWNTRMTSDSYRKINERYKEQIYKVFRYSMHQQPTTLESCYARTIEGAKKRDYDFNMFMQLYLCYFTLGAFEYCLEILNSIESLFGGNETIEQLRQKTLETIDERTRKHQFSYYLDAIKFKFKKIFPSMFWSGSL